MHKKKPLVLIILDGWGYRETKTDNAIATAHTPHWDAWWASYPHKLLEASGPYVGLPVNQMGNSEVGHKHLGAGRIILEDLTRIQQSIIDGDFFHIPLFETLIADTQAEHKTLHLLGLLSPGGVHSHEEHLFAFLKLCHQKKFDKVRLHLFLDGRDTPPHSALESINLLNKILIDYPVGRIASLSGRYYAMDRDARWDRTALAYKLIVDSESAHHFPSAEEAIQRFYQQGQSDEFIPPTLIGPSEPMVDGDAVFFFNFRADRARQLTKAFIEEPFSGFKRRRRLKFSHFVTMTQFSTELPTAVAFPPLKHRHTLGEMIALNGLKQLRIAETEKYAHVTYFFNGGSEDAFPNEDRLLIPSPKIATYDLQPEMSAPQLTKALITAIEAETYDLIICNYANADMVGHSGNFAATVKAVQCLDGCLSEVWQAVKLLGGQVVITADHGNAELMYNKTSGQAHTAHTNQPVPLLYLGEGWHFNDKEGSLIDVAPSLLILLGIKPPEEMTGHALLVSNHEHT